MSSDFDRIIVVGAGRLGSAITPALADAGWSVAGPVGRGAFPVEATDRDVVLLCVADHAIESVAASIPRGPLVGHCSGALTLDVLGDHAAFAMHPLLSITSDATDFRGAACAIAGRTARAREVARVISASLGMEPIDVPDALRPVYHAAASMASNYLVTIEDAAEQLSRATGVERRHLARLAQSALGNWARVGGRAALTGPIVRGDDATVARQRAAVEREAPQLVHLWDALADATRALARTSSPDSRT
jgi:predicted short-subunit dehydrogenase-like oxidoreductase (DUF2520 family)